MFYNNSLTDNKEIGSRIRKEREKLDLSRNKFAETIDLSRFYLGQIERGDRSMSLNTLTKISDTLKVSIDYILKGNIPYGQNIFIFESEGEYIGGQIDEEMQQLLQLVLPIPKDKMGVITDIIKTILPHINS